MKFAMLLAFLITQFGLAQIPDVHKSVECPDDHPYTGVRKNWTFGFTIVIPDHLKGYWNSARCVKDDEGCTCMGDHGTLIPLENEAGQYRGQIEFYAALDTSEHDSIGEQVNRRLENIRERSRNHVIHIQKRRNYKLGGLKAQRVVVRYFDEELGTWCIEDFIETLRDGSAYTPYLRTSEDNYKSDLRIFEQMLASFSLTRGEYTEDVKSLSSGKD